MKRMRRLLLATAIAAASFSLPACADPLTDGRYLPKSGEFSIDMHENWEQTFHLSKDMSSANYVVADFLWRPGASYHGMFAARNIEWFTLAQSIDVLDSDTAAATLAGNYLSDRFPGGRFKIVDRRKARDEAARLYYVFHAKGIATDTPADWYGVVLVFDKAIGLVSQVSTANLQSLTSGDASDEATLVRWAMSLRPEK